MSEEKNLYKISFAAQKTNYPESRFVELKQKNCQYISYGDNNLMNFYLDGLYSNNSLHSGIINKKVSYIYGNGLYSDSNNLELVSFINRCNAKGDSLNHIYRKLVEDFERYGGFAIEIIYNKLGEFQDIYYIDCSKLRISQDEKKIFFSNDWANRFGNKKVIKYDPYIPNSIGSTSQIFWYKGNARGYYPEPPYRGGLMAIESFIEFEKFNLSTVQHGFFPSFLISYTNGIPTEEQKEEIEKDLIETWGGSSNSGGIITSYCNPGETPPAIIPIQQPNLKDMFIVQRQNAIDSIFYGHQISVKTIFGVQVPGQLGNSKEFQEGTEVFTQDYVKPVQRELMEVLNHLLSVKFKGSDLSVNQIEPIGAAFTDERLIASQMTKSEFRSSIKKSGQIQTIEIPEGEEMVTVDQINSPDKGQVLPEGTPIVNPVNPANNAN